MKSRALVVEDEPAISEPLVTHLVREGFDAEVAATIEDATASLLRERPDIVLLDVMLPDGDGRDLCREIRKTSDYPSILTARARRPTRSWVSRRGDVQGDDRGALGLAIARELAGRWERELALSKAEGGRVRVEYAAAGPGDVDLAGGGSIALTLPYLSRG